MATTLLRKAIEEIERLKTKLYARDERYFEERKHFADKESSFYESVSATFFAEINLRISPNKDDLLKNLGENYEVDQSPGSYLHEIKVAFK